MDVLAAARAQMALSLGFHMVLAASGIAMPVLMLMAEGLWLRTGPAPLPRPGPQVGQGHRPAVCCRRRLSGPPCPSSWDCSGRAFHGAIGSMIGRAFALGAALHFSSRRFSSGSISTAGTAFACLTGSRCPRGGERLALGRAPVRGERLDAGPGRFPGRGAGRLVESTRSPLFAARIGPDGASLLAVLLHRGGIRRGGGLCRRDAPRPRRRLHPPGLTSAMTLATGRLAPTGQRRLERPGCGAEYQPRSWPRWRPFSNADGRPWSSAAPRRRNRTGAGSGSRSPTAQLARRA